MICSFNVVSAVFDLPKEMEEEKAARREAMQKLFETCDNIPFYDEFYRWSSWTTKEAVGKSNTNAASDLGYCSGILKLAFIRLVNVRSTFQESATKTSSKNTIRGLELLQTGSDLADKYLQTILEKAYHASSINFITSLLTKKEGDSYGFIDIEIHNS